jgi:hypothetical protein
MKATASFVAFAVMASFEPAGVGALLSWSPSFGSPWSGLPISTGVAAPRLAHFPVMFERNPRDGCIIKLQISAEA